MDRLVILAPHLHRANAPEWMPRGTRLLDPGVAREEDCRYLPETLPFDPGQARKALAAMKEFVSRFRSPGELASITASLDEPRAYSGMARDEMQALDAFIRGQYTAGGRAIPEDEEKGHALVSAQLTLLLAWSAEEAFLDVARLSEEYGRTWDRFRLAVGLEEESDAEETLSGVPGRLVGVSPVEFPEPGRELFYSWPQVMESLLAFLPQGSTLYIADERLAAAWKEAGMGFREESELAGGDPPFGRLLRGAGPGWLLSGRRQAAPGKSWHEEQYQVVYWERVE